MLRNIRLLIEYDGFAYAGWQLQKDIPTIQGALLVALEKTLPATCKQHGLLYCAGRTDAGVHAMGQVVNFFTTYPHEARRLCTGLNFYLPDSIRVHRSEDAPDTFNARHSSIKKRYHYKIYNGPHQTAIDRQRAWHIRNPIDITAMQQAAQHLLGELDFESFRSAHCDAEHARRHMMHIDIIRETRLPVGQFVHLVFEANAFCRHMCRILTGTLLEVGIGKRAPHDMIPILQSRDRTSAGITAPPWGLTLLEVVF